ncbi:F-box domain containing protein [Tanacetum coccineum]
MKFWFHSSPIWKLDTWKEMFLGQRKRPKRTVELHFEIIESEILPRLPARSLIRCMCVCKQWKSFISTREFARMNLYHIRNDQYPTHSKLIEMSCSSQTFTSRNCENLKNHDSTTVRPIPFATGGDEVFIVVGSLDGLVCVALERTCELVIWNPLTTAYKKLSMSNAPPFFRRNRDAIGFYFDSSNNDYKLLQVVSNDPSGAYIYSQKSDSWKKIDCLVSDQCFFNSRWSFATFLGQSLYFKVKCFIRMAVRRNLIVTFDVKSEKFRNIRFPSLFDKHLGVSLVVVKGCIHLCVAYGKFTDTDKPFLADSKGELWRMDDGDCWTKVAVFFRAQHSPLRFNNFYVSRNGNSIVILDHNNLLYKLDIEDLATNFYVNFYIWHPDYKHSIYSETLVSPNP